MMRLGGEVSKLVCRAILRAARSKAGARDLLKSVSSGEDSPTSPFLKGDAGALCGLTSVGRRRALELRCVDEPPQLVVVAPERAALQTALLAFPAGRTRIHGRLAARSRALSSASDSSSRMTPPPSPRLAFRPVDQTGVPRFVAHDAARYAPAAATRELRLEYGAVDFGACDDGVDDALTQMIRGGWRGTPTRCSALSRARRRRTLRSSRTGRFTGGASQRDAGPPRPARARSEGDPRFSLEVRRRGEPTRTSARELACDGG